MRATDSLIDEIVRSSQIPSGHGREVLRELRSHVDDFVLHARCAGHPDDEIERMVLASFGDPQQMGRNFAWVYRRERAVRRLATFSLSTLATALLTASAILAVQAGVGEGFGTPILRTIGTHHTIIELKNIAATVAAYAGLLAISRRRRLSQAAALVALLAAFALHVPYLIFGIANAIFLRLVQIRVKPQTARFGVVAAGFTMLGLLISVPSPASFASWLVMGLGYQMMTWLAARTRQMSTHLQE
ncbi:MAG TPA: hypothetical protein VKU19_31430 [Bryobacteraceae bacterium]|nr:hypothetical protein [Bryobacteraceae bacterium]